MTHFSLIVIIVISTALMFDFTNGVHDTADAMATSIATGALGPRTAVLLGVRALARRETDTGHGGTVALTGASLCFTACAAMVLYSIHRYRSPAASLA